MPPTLDDTLCKMDDQDAKRRARASNRASEPGVQFMSAEEALRLDARLAEKQGGRKKRHSSSGRPALGR